MSSQFIPHGLFVINFLMTFLQLSGLIGIPKVVYEIQKRYNMLQLVGYASRVMYSLLWHDYPSFLLSSLLYILSFYSIYVSIYCNSWGSGGHYTALYGFPGAFGWPLCE